MLRKSLYILFAILLIFVVLSANATPALASTCSETVIVQRGDTPVENWPALNSRCSGSGSDRYPSGRLT